MARLFLTLRLCVFYYFVLSTQSASFFNITLTWHFLLPSCTAWSSRGKGCRLRALQTQREVPGPAHSRLSGKGYWQEHHVAQEEASRLPILMALASLHLSLDQMEATDETA